MLILVAFHKINSISAYFLHILKFTCKLLEEFMTKLYYITFNLTYHIHTFLLWI